MAALYVIGKSTATSTNLGTLGTPWEDIQNEGTQFIIAAYGSRGSTLTKTVNLPMPPKLCLLPPTSKSFFENLKRAHK